MKLYFISLFSLLSFANQSRIDLSSKQWALKNIGQKYTIQDGKYSRLTVVGKAGVDINFPSKIKEIESNSEEIIVAVIDSGVDINHPDLKDNIWSNPLCDGLSQKEKEKLPCHGINYIENSADVTDNHGHGTHVAGIIAAGRNGFGIDGATHKKIKIMPIRAVKEKFSGLTHNSMPTSELIVKSIGFALKNKAKVINISLGFPKILVGPKIKYVIDQAISRGVVIVAAAGNNNKDRPVFPCGYKGVICVGGIDATGSKVSSSNYGHKVDIYAPGESIISTYPLEKPSDILRITGYEKKSGSSQAAPYVSSLAALILSKEPHLSASEVTQRILSNARIINSEEYGQLRVVDFQASIENKKTLSLLDLKSLSQITVSGNGEFSFKIPLRYSASREIKAHITSLDKNVKVSLDKDSYEAGIDREFIAKGKIFSFDAHSRSDFVLTVKESGFTTDYKLSVDFNVLANRVKNRKIVKSIPASAAIRIGQTSKLSYLKKVLDQRSSKSVQDFYFVKKGDSKSLFLIKEGQDEFSATKLKFIEDVRISNVIKEDLNFDGKQDYLVYGATKDLRYYFLSFFNAQGENLFSNRIFKWRSTQFGGLKFSRSHVGFSFLRLDHPRLGPIKVPTFMKKWNMPFIDNGTDPIDRLDNIIRNRAYYFSPVVSTSNDEQDFMQLRTLESLRFYKENKNLLGLSYIDELQITHILDQTDEQRSIGEVSTLLNYGRGLNKSAQVVKFSTPTSFFYDEDAFDLSLDRNDVTSIMSKTSFASQFVMASLYERNYIRFYDSGALGNKYTLRSTSWNDPFVSTIGAHKKGNKLNIFIESRYNIYSAQFDENGNTTYKTLGVNRETSYPGGSFSESFYSLLLNDQLGVFSDTQSVYGNTVSIWLNEDGDFIRPISMNYKIKNNCVSLGAMQIRNGAVLYAHCTNGQASWVESYDFLLTKWK